MASCTPTYSQHLAVVSTRLVHTKRGLSRHSSTIVVLRFPPENSSTCSFVDKVVGSALRETTSTMVVASTLSGVRKAGRS